MPDVTVSANVDTMLRAANNAAIRSAIGLGQTDAPTFLAQSLTNNASIASGKIIIGLDGTNDYTIQAYQGATKVGRIGFNELSNNIVIAPFADTLTVFTGGIALGANKNTVLLRDGADGILAQRNGTNAQAFRVFNTFLGTTANEWAELDWKTDGTLRLGTNQAGTGAIKAVNFVVGGTARWGISGTTNPSTTGHLLATTDNTYDIGAATANRPANINAASSVRGEYFSMTSGLTGVTRSYLQSPSTGVVTLFNAAGNDFGRLQLGGTTSAFPAIKRVGAGIEIRTADDATHAAVAASEFYGNNGGITKLYLGGAGVVQTVSTGYFAIASSATSVFAGDTYLSRSAAGVWQMGTSSTNATADLRLRSVIQQPPATITPANNGDLVVEATSNTLLTFKFKGSDGTVRSGTLVVA